MSRFLPPLPFGFVLVVSRGWEPEERRVLAKQCLDNQRRMGEEEEVDGEGDEIEAGCY